MCSDTTASRSTPTNGSTAPGVEAAEHERQFREMLEFCPAAMLVADEDGRLLFHNARLREILEHSKDELDLSDTRMFWHDLAQRERIIDRLRQQGGAILNEKVTWRTRKGTLVHLLMSYVLNLGTTYDPRAKIMQTTLADLRNARGEVFLNAAIASASCLYARGRALRCEKPSLCKAR